MSVRKGEQGRKGYNGGDRYRSLRLFSETTLDLWWLKGSIESPTHICCVPP